ncbi:type VI secretion system-associated FHA domain protein TagH [Sphingomonas gilva]|uniref:Type VI secretion system-associated FHA domain protein TagH n=1 Tax=Sphingomonas gilva TaxID=2305907 RepID=A0A396RL27_9SPHN|nr:type VI secretion system-associated FHA domain protein TagH [Sphingomonas gilva]RHW17008.1 type VI secretion system-associated FHA domain protein TagH [Sphingomonas gilva]
MTLTFRIRNFDRLDNGMPTEFVLNRRGAMIGRSPTCDWSLPDPRNYISSRHCEIGYGDGHYQLTDVSTNGTFLNGAPDRMAEPRRVAQGDVFLIGQYEVVAELSGEAVAAIEREQDAAQAAQSSGWTGWDSHGGAQQPPAEAPAAASSGWATPPAAPSGGGSGWAAPPPAPSGGGQSWAPQTGPSLARPAAHRAHEGGAAAAPSVSGAGWSPAQRAPEPPVRSTWEEQMPAPDPASGWSSAAPDRAPPPSPDDIWGKISEGNVVDWARGGFGQPIETPADPLGLNKPQAREALPTAQPQMSKFDDGWGAPPAGAPAPSANESWAAKPPERTSAPRAAPAAPPPPPAAARPAPAPAPAPAASSAQALETFIAGAGITRDQLKEMSPETLARAGGLFRKLIAGLVVMVEARARAKSQMGAEATSLEFDGNNPIKFARTPEQAIAQLLNPPERGFMDSGRAVEDAFYDLQSHQMATLKAMQGALKATLDRFSPTAIKARAENKGLLAKIMPGARDAALWSAYEREFGGVAQGSDEAFMDVFAKEFRKAYEDQARKRR